MGTATSSPFDCGQEVDSCLKRREWHWKLHAGKRRGESKQSEVSIFRAGVVALGDKAKFARHSFNKTRTLRHPHILEYIDGSDGDIDIMLVTEAVTPLPDWLSRQREDQVVTNEQLEAMITWGLRCGGCRNKGITDEMFNLKIEKRSWQPFSALFSLSRTHTLMQ